MTNIETNYLWWIAIQGYLSDNLTLTTDQQNALDWKTLTDICDFLQNFHNATNATEKPKATIDIVLPTIDFLLEMFEEKIEKNQYYRYIYTCIDAE